MLKNRRSNLIQQVCSDWCKVQKCTEKKKREKDKEVDGGIPEVYLIRINKIYSNHTYLWMYIYKYVYICRSIQTYIQIHEYT